MRHVVLSCLAALGGLACTAGSASSQTAIERECSPQDIRQALAGDYAGPPCRFTEMPDDMDAAPRSPSPQLAGAPPVARQAPLPAVRAPSRRHIPAAVAPPPPRAQETAHEVVRLDDSFFSGGLVGGVGRAPTISYVYRGVIVIDGTGRVSTLAPGQVTSAPVLRMDRRAALRTYPVGH